MIESWFDNLHFYVRSASNVCLINISQVALGDMNELLVADYNANNLPKGKLRSVNGAKFFRSIPILHLLVQKVTLVLHYVY